MPIKYTLEQVKQLFEQKGCSLQSNSYINQLNKLNYIASCGHENVTTVKLLMNGYGTKCRNCALEISSYEKIYNHFESKKCKLNYTREEFNLYYINCKQKLNYIALCGHENNVCWKNFHGLNQGLNCPSCVNKNTGNKLKELYSGDNNLSSLKQEYSCVNYFTELVKSNFEVKKTFDGCKADIVIRPNLCNEDIWLGIQVKTTNKKTDREQYYFRLNNGNYENCLLLCICEEDKNIWLIPYEDVKGQKTIGIAKKSKYNVYEVNKDNLFEKILAFYNSIQNFTFDILNVPTSKSQKQEQEYRNLRETTINFIEFKNNDIEGLVYDFMIGNKKVQEKVGSQCKKKNPNLFGFTLSKYDCRINGKIKQKSYDIGDNDLYWLNCKNSIFYVIPESVLIEKGFIGKDCKQQLYVSPTNKNTSWCNEYLFNYNNVDKQRLISLIHF